MRNFYDLQENDFYRLKALSTEDREQLKKKFIRLGFSALNFTDSRSRYQFYNLAHLWGDINRALEKGIKLWHPATEPISAEELYYFLTGKKFKNELGDAPADYDYRTIYDTQHVLEDIKEFVGLCGI